jgi:hypothetical protein
MSRSTCYGHPAGIVGLTPRTQGLHLRTSTRPVAQCDYAASLLIKSEALISTRRNGDEEGNGARDALTCQLVSPLDVTAQPRCVRNCSRRTTAVSSRGQRGAQSWHCRTSGTRAPGRTIRRRASASRHRKALAMFSFTLTGVVARGVSVPISRRCVQFCHRGWIRG